MVEPVCSVNAPVTGCTACICTCNGTAYIWQCKQTIMLDSGYENIRLYILKMYIPTCWLSRPQFMARIFGRTFNWRDCTVGWYFSQQSHHAGVTFSGHKLCSSTSQKLNSAFPRTYIRYVTKYQHTSKLYGILNLITHVYKIVRMPQLNNVYFLHNMSSIITQHGRCYRTTSLEV